MGEIYEEEIKYLDLCIRDIEKLLKWGPKEEWTNHNFKQLSDRIADASGITLSISSIRRIFGQDKSYKEKFNPQLETKNALAMLLEYENWASFKQSKITIAFYRTKGFKKALRYGVMALLIVAVGFLLYRSGLFSLKNHSTTKEKIVFNGKDLTGTTPHTVIINYDISMVKDSLFIDFGESDTETIYLPPNEHTITYTYGFPEYYKIVLKTRDGKWLKYIPCHIITKSWQRSIRGKGFKTFYHPVKETDSLNRLFMSPAFLSERTKQEASRTREIWVDYRYIHPFDIDGDNFRFHCIIKNDPREGGISCFNSSIHFLGAQGHIEVTLIGKGCARWAEVEAGEQVINGKFHDLTALTLDLSDWRKISIHNNNKNISLLVEDSLVYTLVYKKEIGLIKGLGFSFRGSGSVDQLELKEIGSEKIYSEDFKN
jgi:hypothetical protein